MKAHFPATGKPVPATREFKPDHLVLLIYIYDGELICLKIKGDFFSDLNTLK